MILGFAHPALVVKDLTKMRSFYCDAFGFVPFSEDTESWQDNPAIDAAIGVTASSVRGCMLAGHNCFLELFEFLEPASHAAPPEHCLPQDAGLRHLCFYVDDLDAEWSRLLALGATPLGTPQKLQGVPAVYMRDPEGNIIELAEMTNPGEDLRHLPGIDRLQGSENDI